MIAGMVLSNLFYVVGAIVAASVVSAFVLLRHRRPKSLEAGIEMFSRELRALQPERRGPAAGSPGSRVVPTDAPPEGGPAPDGGPRAALGNGSQRGGRRGGAGAGGGSDGPGRGRGFAPTPLRQAPLPVHQVERPGSLGRGPAVTRLGSTAASTSSPASASPAGSSSAERFAAEPTTQPTNVVALPAEKSGRNEARAPSPHQEDEPG
jgi:hypothetical protein